MTVVAEPLSLDLTTAPPAAPARYSGGSPARGRTLMDIFAETARRHPTAAAIDDGATVLSYRALSLEVERLRTALHQAGVGRGDRVGVRVPSGTADLYISILAVLAAGASYVPVDADDPAERAELVFTEAGVRIVLGAQREITVRGEPSARVEASGPRPDDDAWIIFTSGSTGKPKGVAVSQRSAAAFVDAEAELFLTEEPIHQRDRVLAGLSVAFDASCEEMWLAWRHGACLVPAPRALVRTGVDLGPWLVRQRITIVSTVPTLAALWPADTLDDVRLLIFGGEACPPELVERLAVEGREVWNTYGPTEATVVACAAQLHAEALQAGEPIRIGLPLRGWELAVVDQAGEVLPMGATGELVIGGVGLARYLDAEKDAEKFAPLPALGWERAYRSGDLVTAEPAGLRFVGRADEQVKLGGRRIELGEVDAALQALPGVAGAAAAVRTTPSGNQLLVGYVVPAASVSATTATEATTPAENTAAAETTASATSADTAATDTAAVAAKTNTSTTATANTGATDTATAETTATDATILDAAASHITASAPAATENKPVFDPTAFDTKAATELLRAALPAALVPLLAPVETLPTRTSGKVDRAALPWPLPTVTELPELYADQAWLAERWAEVLGIPPTGQDANFFSSGGGSLSAARLVSMLRERYPHCSVSDVYQHPTLGALSAALGAMDTGREKHRTVRPTPRSTGLVQTLALLPLFTLVGLRWALVAAALGDVLALTGAHWARTVPWWALAVGWLVLFSPPGRLAVAAGGARVLLRGLRPGDYPRGGSVHLRLWAAERLAELSGATDLAGAWLSYYARALGAQLGEGADLHSLPPVTGMLRVGKGAAIEPEVDLAGHWLDGDVLHIGRIRIGAGATVGARSTLFPGARIGKRAEIESGSGVLGHVPAGQRWAGVPAQRSGKVSRERPTERPPRSRRWTFGYGVTSLGLSLLHAIAAVPGVLVLGLFLVDKHSVVDKHSLAGTPELGSALLLGVPLATIAGLATYALLTLLAVRALSIGLRPGYHPVHGRTAWQAWTTERLMSAARTVLFPLYASLYTPAWLRALGMRVGKRVEASTLLALPSMTTIGDGAFLADDTMVGTYELGGGWLRIGTARIGKRAFLGNSGMTAPGRSVPKRGLVGVLSSTPERAKAGSSWLGMPPMKLPRAAATGDASRTFDPPRTLIAARAAVELCRLIPVMCSVAIGVLALGGLIGLANSSGWLLAAAASGVLLLGGGLLAVLLAAGAKWLLVGTFRAVEKPLWSSFVWRTELADAFVETLAVPWLVGALGGTPLMNMWHRMLGAKVGRGAWCESYWLPEADLVRIGSGAVVNRGCVVQTHLFHDRILRMNTVTIAEGATIGAHAIVLPGAGIGANSTVGPASLVMGGEQVPSGSRWLGNPIVAWTRGA